MLHYATAKQKPKYFLDLTSVHRRFLPVFNISYKRRDPLNRQIRRAASFHLAFKCRLLRWCVLDYQGVDLRTSGHPLKRE